MKNISDHIDDSIAIMKSIEEKLDIALSDENRDLKIRVHDLQIELEVMTGKYDFLCDTIDNTKDDEQLDLWDYAVGRRGPWY